jgi:hypothetical protein
MPVLDRFKAAWLIRWTVAYCTLYVSTQLFVLRLHPARRSHVFSHLAQIPLEKPALGHLPKDTCASQVAAKHIQRSNGDVGILCASVCAMKTAGVVRHQLCGRAAETKRHGGLSAAVAAHPNNRWREGED